MIEKGTWVEITRTVLEPNERADNIPEVYQKHSFKNVG
ncbi:hypothetical protein [Haloimpatiens lingqiaonensis]